MAATLEQLASLVRGRLVGDGHVPIRAARPVGEAGPGDITFVDDPKYAKVLRASTAAAAIVGPHFRKAVESSEASLPTIEVDDALGAFLAVRDHLGETGQARWSGIHPLAYVDPTAEVGEGSAIYPFAYVGAGAVVGAGSTLHPGAIVSRGCKLGIGVTLHPHVVLYEGVALGDRVEIHAGTVLGSDGFGYRQADGKHVKVPQTGTVEVGADVEIGANGTIDRGTFGATTIGEGSKIDNLVMVGHNNRIGRHNLLCAQVGIAGSCKTGDHVVMAGQVGIKDHTEIGDGAIIGAQAGVHRNVPDGQQVLGSPAMPIKEQRQLFALVARLPEMSRQVRKLTAEVDRLTSALAEARGDEASS